MAGRRERPHVFPHRLVGRENPLPGEAEFIHRGLTAQHPKRPARVVVGIDRAGLEVVLTL